MEQRARERIALVVFVLLLAFAGIVLFSYFSTGRSWTMAATFVDDKVGGMEGYMAVVYSGTMDAETLEAATREEKDERISSGEAASIAQAPAPQQSIVNLQSASDVAEVAVEESESSILADTIGLRILSLYPRLIHERYDGVFVSDVRDLYERKGADVVTIDLSTPSPYVQPTVVSSHGRSVGIYALTSYINRRALGEYMDFFDEANADIVVCITPRLSLLSGGEGTDVIIATEPLATQSLSPEAFASSSLVLEDPERGDVGVILFSLNMVPASHTIFAL